MPDSGKQINSKHGSNEEDLATDDGESELGSSWPLETIHSEEETKSLDMASSVESSHLPPPPPSIMGVQTVTSKRKQELLLQARADRLFWIHKVPLPYRNAKSLDPLENFLKNSHASRLLPRVSDIIYHLYGDDGTTSNAKKNANAILGSDHHKNLTTTTTTPDSVYLTGHQILSHEIKNSDDHDEQTKGMLVLYHRFLKYLEDPASNVCVQGMRTFCRNFTDLSDSTTAKQQLHSYLKSTAQNIPTELRPCLEAFVYGHCREAIERMSSKRDTEDTEFATKVQSLQFVQPSHLDIVIEETLVPNAVLESIDAYHSVYDKLQRVLQMYRAINEALQQASDTLPSADDVLPGIIYSVLRSNAKRLVWNLTLIEEWSSEEYLRGEAGYAFTNLYGAVQFITDLKDSSSLTISQDDFALKIAECRKQVDDRIKQRVARVNITTPSSLPEDLNVPRPPTASEIRLARKNGQVIDLEWALAWQKGQTVEKEEDVIEDTADDRRPQYSFLATQPDDVRLRDVPKLLEEYRDLYHCNENYMAEKAKRASRARRKLNDDTERDLIATARSLELL